MEMRDYRKQQLKELINRYLKDSNCGEIEYYRKIFPVISRLSLWAQGFVHFYKGEFDRAFSAWEKWRYKGVGEAFILKALNKQLEAGERFFELELYALSGVEYEKGGDYRRAKLSWEKFIQKYFSSAPTYILGLSYFNLGRVMLKGGDKGESIKFIMQAIELLEEAADGFEALGLRDRAFDCYQVIKAIGEVTESFENIAEGYFNAIRVLKQDNLKYYALKHYEDFYRIALDYREFHAGAAIMEEASRFCENNSLPYTASYKYRSGLSWIKAGEELIKSGQSPYLAENAFLAAVDCFNSLGMMGQVGECYHRLSNLPLEKEKIDRYSKLYQEMKDNVIEDSFPPNIDLSFLQKFEPYPEVWNFDTVEWEMKGDLLLVVLDILSDKRMPTVSRRYGMIVGILLCEFSEPLEVIYDILEALCATRSYNVLSVIESLFETYINYNELVSAIIERLPLLPFKRSFNLIFKALRLLEKDYSNKRLYRAILNAIRGLSIGLALDQLIKIFYNYGVPPIREAVISSIGRIINPDATEFLLLIYKSCDYNEKRIIERALQSHNTEECKVVLERFLYSEDKATKGLIHRLLKIPEGV